VSNGTYKKIFAPNHGMLLDIVVCDTSLNDWQILLDHLSARYTCVYSENGLVHPLPRAEAVFERRNIVSVSLECMLMGLTVNCYFFLVNEIELDLLPDDVNSWDSAEQVFKLMKDMASILKKDIFLTPEHDTANAEEVRNMSVATADAIDGSIRSRLGELD
jgi:hypothetical protein